MDSGPAVFLARSQGLPRRPSGLEQTRAPEPPDHSAADPLGDRSQVGLVERRAGRNARGASHPTPSVTGTKTPLVTHRWRCKRWLSIRQLELPTRHRRVRQSEPVRLEQDPGPVDQGTTLASLLAVTAPVAASGNLGVAAAPEPVSLSLLAGGSPRAQRSACVSDGDKARKPPVLAVVRR